MKNKLFYISPEWMCQCKQDIIDYGLPFKYWDCFSHDMFKAALFA